MQKQLQEQDELAKRQRTKKIIWQVILWTIGLPIVVCIVVFKFAISLAGFYSNTGKR